MFSVIGVKSHVVRIKMIIVSVMMKHTHTCLHLSNLYLPVRGGGVCVCLGAAVGDLQGQSVFRAALGNRRVLSL